MTTVIAGDQYRIRHIGPRAAIWPDCPTPNFTLLGCTTMVARPLPHSDLPTSPDFAAGSWTGRLGDSGEATLTFPNGIAGDGVPWRQRFDPTGHLQFIEIAYNGEPEFVGVIDQIPTIDQQKVQLHAADGWWLLKKAYERDWIVTQAPRDVIERGTQVWGPTIVDGFPAGALNAQWSTSVLTDPNGTVTIGPGGGCILANSGLSGGTTGISSTALTVPQTGVWRASVGVRGNLSATDVFKVQVFESNGDQYVFELTGDGGYFYRFNGASMGSGISAAAGYTVQIESDGSWMWAFGNGQLIGCFRRNHNTTTSLQIYMSIGTSLPGSATIENVKVSTLQPFLQRGTDKGDYVLPGDASTYPNGGLHARYFNDNDLQSDGNAISKVLAPTRTNAYVGSGGPEYMDQQDPQIQSQNPPGFSQTSPGAGPGTQSWWSGVWFGAVYLKLSQGNYNFQVAMPGSANPAVRLWVGKTQLGTQIIDAWSYGGSSTFLNATLTASSLAGALPYGAGTVARDGWYPIKLEWSVSGTARNSPALNFTPPAAYTDPGGTHLSAVSQAVPATSLSPLGMVDQRYQGISHFDLVQQTVQSYGYQASVEPKQIESGLFPGVLAPRIREGHDTAVILNPDDGPSQDGEGLLNYSSGLDATDFASSLQGNGAGFQNGNTGQLQAEVYDPATVLASLFEVQQWTDFSDASFGSLLQALLNSQLSLQLTPWQLLSADPNGRPRQAFTWPLTGALAAMRWRPGDGVRIQARNINVWDTSPRQILTITRNMLPNGIASTQASFALRPRTPARVLKQQVYKATRWARNYQRQKVTLTGTYASGSIAAGATGTASAIQLDPGDNVIAARLRIGQNAAPVAFHVFVNGADVTGTLNGPWTNVPVTLDLLPVLGIASGLQAFYAQIQNQSGTTASTFSYQLLVDVLR